MFATTAELTRIAAKLSPIDAALVASAAEELNHHRQGRHAMAFDRNDLPDIATRLKALELYEAYQKAMNEADDMAECDAARDAYEDFESPELMTDWHDNVIHCGVCDAPLWVDDEVLEDAHTGEMFLRVALGLPARAQDDEPELPLTQTEEVA